MSNTSRTGGSSPGIPAGAMRGPGGGPGGGGPGGHGARMIVRPKNAVKTFTRLLGYLKKDIPLLILVLGFVAVSSLASTTTTYYIRPIINDYILPGNITGLAWKLGEMALIYLVGIVSSFAYSRIMIHVSQRTMTRIRKSLFDHLQTLPLSYFDKHTHGELMSRFTNDVDTVSNVLNTSFTNFFSSIVTFASTIVMMLIISPALFAITAVVLVIMTVVVRIIGSRSRENFRRQQAALGAVNGYIEEMIEGQKVIKVFCYEDKATRQFAELNEELRDSATKANQFAHMMMPIMGNLNYVNYAITACIGGIFGVRGLLDIGGLGTFLQYCQQVSRPINQISNQINSILSSLAGAERIFMLLDEVSEVDEGKATMVPVSEGNSGELVAAGADTGRWAWKVPMPDGSAELIEAKGDVRFVGVHFAYVPDKPVLRDLTFYAKPGQKVALVGSTGAGKTTVTNLITRFYDIGEGSISYDGLDIRDIKKNSLRGSLAMVLQDVHLFTGTVYDNIRYGRLDATDEEVIEAAKLANADSFIRRLPQGYETVLSADGGNLSQGQRQLLSIARAAVADPAVIILDEATSSIDTRTERLIEKGMDQLMEGRTVFVIAHRLSTVRNSDVIIVIEHGEIVEKGNHDELIAQRGRYYQLYMGLSELD